MTSSGLSDGGRGVGGMLSRPFLHGRDLLRELVVRDMKLRYKRSYLGVLWTLVNPLMQLLVYNFVFVELFKVQDPNYIAKLFVGITCWNWFSVAVIEATGAIVQNRDLIRQPGFPAMLLPNVTVLSHLVHFLITFPILFAVLIVKDIPITPAIAWLPVVILVQYVLTLACCLLAACLHVSFRDTQYLLGVALMLAFFLTPILYSIEIVPERYLPYYELNPMGHLVDAYRAALIRGEAPDASSLSTVAGGSVALLGIAYVYFRRASTGFVEQL